MYLKKQVKKGVMSIFCAGLLIGVCVGLRSTGLIVGGLVVGGLIVGVAWFQLSQALQSAAARRIITVEDTPELTVPNEAGA